EAIEEALRRVDGEARRALLVERAAPDEPAARLAQLGALLDDGDEIRRPLHRLHRAVLDPGHYRASAYDSANRSVMPATNSTISSRRSPRACMCSTIARIVDRARSCSGSD